MSAVRRVDAYGTLSRGQQYLSQQVGVIPFYVKPQNKETYFQRPNSTETPTFNEDDIKKEIKYLYATNLQLKNDAVVYPYGYNNNKILISEPRHFPQILFGNYTGSTDKSSYQSMVFEIKINHNPSKVNDLTIDLLSRDGYLILSYSNHFIIPMMDGFHIIVDEERHQLNLFDYSLPVHKTCNDINRNFINIKNHKKWLRIKFNDGENEYVIKSPVFCLSTTCFRGTLKHINKNTKSIKEMHELILAIINNETIFRTAPLRNAQQESDELDAFILEAEESVSNIHPLWRGSIIESIDTSPKILPIQPGSIKNPVINHTNNMIIPKSHLLKTSGIIPQGESHRLKTEGLIPQGESHRLKTSGIIPQGESVLLVSRRWSQMIGFFSCSNHLNTNVYDIFTNTFLYNNVTKLFTSKYYGGIRDGMSLLTKIRNSPGGYGTIILSNTPYSNYICWMIRTIDRSTIEGGEEGEIIEIIPDHKCSIGFYVFNQQFEGMFDNISRFFPNGSPFETSYPEIMIDTIPAITIDTINAIWKNEGIKPLIF